MNENGPNRLIDQAALLSLLVVSASFFGLFRQEQFYSTPSLKVAFVPNDATNLLFGIPVVLVTPAYYLKKKSPIGRILWPGALAYHLYGSLTYVIALYGTLSSALVIFALHLLVVAITVRRLFEIVTDHDTSSASIALECHKPSAKFGGGFLLFWGVLFSIRACGILFSKNLEQVGMAVSFADVVISPVWIVGGYNLFRSSAFDLGIALLFQASSLFVALEVIGIVRPFLVEGAAMFSFLDFAAVGVMGLTVMVPCASLLNSRLRTHSGVKAKEDT